MIAKAFITHKQAEQFADCQDRYGINYDTKSIAVSDGMGSTWQQKIWAQILVDTFIKSANWYPTKENIKQLCQTWRKKVVDFIQNLKDTNAPEYLVYLNERNLANGRSAGATFVGIRFDGNKWSGEVLGDSCLIEWDGNEAKFNTSQDTDAFDSYPDYFDSDPLKDGKGTPKSIEGTLKDGTILFLVSDPFSEFMLEHSKQGNVAKYIQQLLSLASHDDFEALVDEWRKEGMHNDDTTLVIVESDNSGGLTITHEDKLDDMIEKEKMPATSCTPNEENSSHSPKEQPQENNTVVESPDVIQSNIETEALINEFLTLYEECLSNKYKKIKYKKIRLKKLKKIFVSIIYDWTKEAAEEALRIFYNKYFTNKK